MSAFFAFVNLGGALEVKTFLAGDFADRTIGCEVASQDAQVGAVFDGLVPGVDDVLLIRKAAVGLYVFERFGDGLAGDGQAVAVQQAAIQQEFHHRADAADADEVVHAVFAEGLYVGKERDALADSRKTSMLSSTSAECAMASRWRMRLVEPPSARQVMIAFRRLCGDIAGLDALLEHFDNGCAGLLAVDSLGIADGGLRELPGASCRVSIALAMVLAVYMPPQEPAPGIAYCSTSLSSSSLSSPLACLPTASNTETMSIGLHSSFIFGQPKDGAAVYKDRGAIQTGEGDHAV